MKYKEKMILKIRCKLFVWSFQPGRHELKDVPVSTLSDLIRLPTALLFRRHIGRYVKFITNFWLYRKNLHNKSWSSLTKIYPRLLYLWYYYLLFWWAEYCGVLPKLLQNPDYSLIPELFIRYNIKIDSIIDKENGKEFLFKDLSILKSDSADILNELLAQININKKLFKKKTKNAICEKIWKFRQKSLNISRNTQCQQELSLDALLDYKDKTAGELFRVWVDLLCGLYDVNSYAENSKEIFGLVAMAIQVVDDMLDSPLDSRQGVINIFNQLLKETRNEASDEYVNAKAYFEQIPYDHLDWAWANKYLPCTCKKTADLITSYIDDIQSISKNKIMTLELCEILHEWSYISLGGG